MGVEAGRYQHPGRTERLDDRGSHPLEGILDDVAGRPRWQRQVHRQAGSMRASHLGRPPSSWVARPLVEGDIQHPGVVPEDGLGAVAVVNIPIDDGDPLTLARPRPVRSRPRC